MLTEWLTRLEPVRQARTEQELEAVYGFRYTIYHEEYGRLLGNVDHERRWVHDADDVADHSTILYTGTPDEITGTVRLRHWEPGAVPEHELHELSMDVVPGIEKLRTGEIGRFMIRRGLRGKLLLASFARRAFDLLAGERQVDLAFCYCAPGLVPHYRKLGGRPFGGRLVHTPDGVMVPLLTVMSDERHLRRMGSPLAPMVRRHFGPGKRRPLEVAPLQALFESEEVPIVVDSEKIWGELQEAVTQTTVDADSFLGSLPEPLVRELAEKGSILRVEPDLLVTRKDHGEEELYLVIEGMLEAVDGERSLQLMGPGELFGEIAFFLPGHRRSASVRALTPGRVLVLRGSVLRRLVEKEPKVAARLLLHIGRVMAERLASRVSE